MGCGPRAFYGAWAGSKPAARKAILRIVSITAMVLSVLSKPMWVTLPFVLLLLDIWPLERATLASAWKLVREKIVYFAVSAISCGITLAVQSHGGAMNSGEAVGFGLRAVNAIVSYVRYLGKVAWPTDLSILYPHPYIPGTGALPWPAWKAVAAGLLLMMITAWVIRARKRRYLVVGWLGFLGTLVPVIGLVQVGVQAMADRYTYLPLIFIFVALSWGLADFVERMAPRFPAIRETIVALALAWLVALAGLAWQQASHWEDSLRLFGHAVAVSPDNAVMQLAYATALAEEGQFAQSAVHGRRAIRIRPEYGAAHSVLGTALSRMGRHRAALNHHARAVELLPDSPEVFLSYGQTLERSGDTPAARAAYRRALELRPDDRPARDSLEKLEANARGEPADGKSN